MLRQRSKLGLADVAVAKRQITNIFLEKINRIVDWESLEKKINAAYSKGKRIDGRPAYPGLVLFKICLIRDWYSLTGSRLTYLIGDRISFTHFIGLSLDDEVPSMTTVRNFEKELKKQTLFEELIQTVDQAFKDKGFIVRKGIIKSPFLMRIK